VPAARTDSAIAVYAACRSCPLTFTRQAWLALPLAGTLTPSTISEHVVRWPATQSIEIRRCRCGGCIARKALGEGVGSTP
jgi:hypothetical protein